MTGVCCMDFAWGSVTEGLDISERGMKWLFCELAGLIIMSNRD